GAATVFYCLVVIATATATPWSVLTGGKLAFVDAARTLAWGHVLAPAVLLTAMLSLVKTWNGVFMMAARMLIALSRNGLLPALLYFGFGRQLSGARRDGSVCGHNHEHAVLGLRDLLCRPFGATPPGRRGAARYRNRPSPRIGDRCCRVNRHGGCRPRDAANPA